MPSFNRQGPRPTESAAPSSGGSHPPVGLAEHALETLFEELGRPMAVVRADGKVAFASESAGAKLLPALSSLDSAGVEGLAEALPGSQVRWLPAEDSERYALVWWEDAERSNPLERARQDWGLTRRQAEVLCLLADGKPNREIARMLSCSERTVELHVASLFRKSGCDSRTALVAKFWRLEA